MDMKWLGICLVLISGSSLGFVLAHRLELRSNNLRKLRQVMASLQSCLLYLDMPLAEALKMAGNDSEGAVKELFESIAELLDGNCRMTVRTAMERQLTVLQDKLGFVEGDCEILLLLSNHLGGERRPEQKNYLLVIEERLKILENDAVQCQRRNGRLYRYAGVCISLGVAILLI